jgi:uncharacterized protein (UPF0276 family)
VAKRPPKALRLLPKLLRPSPRLLKVPAAVAKAPAAKAPAAERTETCASLKRETKQVTRGTSQHAMSRDITLGTSRAGFFVGIGHACAVTEVSPFVCGIGLGLRQAFAEPLFAQRDLPELAFLEIHPENYLERGGRFAAMLERATERWPLLTHGLSLGFGAVEPAEPDYVAQLKQFLQRIHAPWHSEHLCFSSADAVMLHDLLPLPFRWEAVRTAVSRIRELRDRLECPIAVENVSYYAHPGAREMDEAEFLNEVLEQSDAKLLLDVNNVFVNSANHGFDARDFLDRMPTERVVQIHIAGHTQRPDGVIVDTHGAAVRDEVYELLAHVLQRTGPVPVLLERDQNYPDFARLSDEVRQLHALYTRALAHSKLPATEPAWR